MKIARHLHWIAATVLACAAPITLQAQAGPPSGASQASTDAPTPLVAKTLQRTVARAERQMRIMGQVLKRMAGSEAALDASLREDFYAAYLGALRVEPALRISVQRSRESAPLAPDKAETLAMAASAYAAACAELRTLRGVVVANGDHRTFTATADASVHDVADALQQAARSLVAITDPSRT